MRSGSGLQQARSNPAPPSCLAFVRQARGKNRGPVSLQLTRPRADSYSQVRSGRCRSNSGSRGGSRMVRFWQRRQVFHGQLALVVLALFLVATSGCKSSSWASRPTWLGGTPSASSLASAPSFDKGVAKPSETAKPYPTTSTPESYALNKAPRAEPTATAAAAPAITYGATPPPAAAAMAASPSSAPGIAPQVGPYSPLTQAPSQVDPAAAVTSGFASAPAFGGASPPPASPTPPAGERFADARGGGFGATPPAQPVPPAAPSADSRYGTATASRFSNGVQPAQPAAPQPTPQPQALAPPPPAVPAAQPTAPMAAPPAVPPTQPSSPVAPAIAPVTPPPPAADGSLPGAIPPPAKRPDPGYRPGGTSSYRPARSLLAGEDDRSPVHPASYDAPQEPGASLPEAAAWPQ
jgi:hypothetical protein